MSLAQLERNLAEDVARVEKTDAGEYVINRPTAFFPAGVTIVLREGLDQVVRGVVALPGSAKTAIERPMLLCVRVNLRVPESPVRLQYDSRAKSFLLVAQVDASNPQAAIDQLVAAYEQLQPLCLKVAEEGKWDEHLVDLVFLYRRSRAN